MPVPPPVMKTRLPFRLGKVANFLIDGVAEGVADKVEVMKAWSCFKLTYCNLNMSDID